MRVLMVSDVFFPRVNGVSTSIETFRHTLVGQGVEVRVVAPRYGDEPTTPRRARPGAAGAARPGGPPRRLARDDARRARAGRRLRPGPRPDALRRAYAGLRAGAPRGVPVLATYHTLFEEYLHHYAPFLPAARGCAAGAAVLAHAVQRPRRVVVPSTAMHERLADYGVRQPDGRPAHRHSAARFAGGDGARFRAAHGIRPEARRWRSSSAASRTRRTSASCSRSAPGCAAARLLLWSPARDRRCPPCAPGGAARPGQSVRFTGYLERHRDLPDCYAAADVFVFASRTETQGLVLLEAMAVGLPVVALAAMGTTDILAPRRGCRVPDDDPACFAAAVVEVLADPALRSRLGSEAWQYARGWSDEAMAQRMAELYRAYHNREIIAQWKAHTKARPA
jgi:1,2-diacylglycerol 3-alpha-glucosyltransferase